MPEREVNGVVVSIVLSPEKYDEIVKLCDTIYHTTVEAMLEATVEYWLENTK